MPTPDPGATRPLHPGFACDDCENDITEYEHDNGGLCKGCRDTPTQPTPNWGNAHHDSCPVTEARLELWRDFAAALNNGPDERNTDPDYNTHRDYLWGAVIEHTAGGDEDLENCRCLTHNTPEMLAMMAENERNYRARTQ